MSDSNLPVCFRNTLPKNRVQFNKKLKYHKNQIFTLISYRLKLATCFVINVYVIEFYSRNFYLFYTHFMKFKFELNTSRLVIFITLKQTLYRKKLSFKKTKN